MGERMLAIRVDEELYTQIKLYVARHDMSIKDFVTNAVLKELESDGARESILGAYLDKYGKMKISLNDLVRYMQMDADRKEKK